jgi:hypothetical protein
MHQFLQICHDCMHKNSFTSTFTCTSNSMNYAVNYYYYTCGVHCMIEPLLY